MQNKIRFAIVAFVVVAVFGAVLAGRRLHRRYQRYICGQNLKKLGQAQMVYANDYDDEYTFQGGYSSAGMTMEDSNDFKYISVGDSLYMLVSEASEVPGDPNGF